MRNIFISIALLAALLLVGACSQDELATLPNGTIRFVIGQASETNDKLENRATPAELGKPLADRFTLTLLRDGTLSPAYDGRFVESMTLPTGTYSITARCGEDVQIGRDAPYYVGTAQTAIEADQTSSVVIPCRVANALVSVNFGRNAEERARFDRFYTDYGVMVKLGSHSMSITSDRETSSIYFPAGSSPELSFFGTLKADLTHQVSMPLRSDDLPAVYQAADHGILTLTLPDPETALTIAIAKAELETVTMEQSIPLSWMPEPRVQANHEYDGSGMLLGTNVSVFHPYPSAGSKTVLANAGGTVVRTIAGTGNRSSAYTSSSEWPYLNAGEYTATYYVTKDGVDKAVGSRNLTILQPNLALTLGGHTSYTKYQEGDVNAANACDAYTVYAPSANFNVSPSLMGMSKYSPKFTCSYAGIAVSIPAGSNAYALENQTGVAASFTPYTLSATASFDGQTFNGSRDFYITGLPANFAPPTQDAGWVGDGKYSFDSDKARLAYYSSSGNIINSNFAVPGGTSCEFSYNIELYSAWLKTSVTITLGSSQLFSATEQAFAKKYTYNSSKTLTVGSNASEFKCAATVGQAGGNCYIDLYSLILKYN